MIQFGIKTFTHASSISVPGRVNLIGEHIDYHNLAVLPMAIQRRVRIDFSRRDDNLVRASSETFGVREFEWTTGLQASISRDWGNYLKAAAQAVGEHWGVGVGVDATITSDLPAAAGLSSSSALLTGFTLALLRANGIQATLDELMRILPEAEHFVGTRGGGMDHAAVLASQSGCALHVGFEPLSLAAVAIPNDWSFLIAHSLETAEKSGQLAAEYNARRSAGLRALERLGVASYAAAIDAGPIDTSKLDDEESRCFEHVTSEARRVTDAVSALRGADSTAFGDLLNASHNSLRDSLRVSTPALDNVVTLARDAGALGARLTGAGFGGCVIVFSKTADCDRIAGELVKRYYSRREGFNPAVHLFETEPSDGALRINATASESPTAEPWN